MPYVIKRSKLHWILVDTKTQAVSVKIAVHWCHHRVLARPEHVLTVHAAPAWEPVGNLLDSSGNFVDLWVTKVSDWRFDRIRSHQHWSSLTCTGKSASVRSSSASSSVWSVLSEFGLIRDHWYKMNEDYLQTAIGMSGSSSDLLLANSWSSSYSSSSYFTKSYKDVSSSSVSS